MTNGKIDPAEYGFPAGLSQPALRALVEAGYTSMEQVAAASAKELLGLHGLGPKAIRLFREAGVVFAGEAGAAQPADEPGELEQTDGERAERMADGDVHEGEAVVAGGPAVADEPAAESPDDPVAAGPPPEAGEEETVAGGEAAPGASISVEALAEVATVEANAVAGEMLIAAERGLPEFGAGAVGPMDAAALVQAWREAGDAGAPWVVFEHGTRVIVAAGGGDPAAQAIALLEQYGAVQFGTDSADFNVLTPEHGRGWIVTSYRPEIATYVSREEAEPYTDEITVGLMGRSKRGRDAESRRVVHVEHKG